MTDEDRQRLLRIACIVVEHEVRTSKGNTVRIPPAPSGSLADCGGLFVTLRTRGRLRGCIGTFTIGRSLDETLRDIAVAAAHDPRFRNSPLLADELAASTVELSLLTPLARTDDPLSLVPGRHGIVIRRGDQSGCFLPQVATERNWDAAEFLGQCCVLKASLPPDGWREPDTEVYLFEANVLETPVL